MYQRREVRRNLRLAPFKGSNINPIGDLGRLGFTPTSGFRTPKHQAALVAQGMTKTTGGAHPKGDALDFMPPKGMSIQEALVTVRRMYPGAKAIPSNKGAIHVTFSGWGKAPDVSGSVRRYGD